MAKSKGDPPTRLIITIIYYLICQKCKTIGVINFVLERTCPEEHPKSKALLANKVTVSAGPKILQLDL